LAYLYNDLGFVLFAQDRATEAEAMFRKALELEPRNILARGNLSQVLYADGRFEDALHELESIVDTLNIYTDAQLSDALGVQIGRERLFSVYRSMSMVYYSLGQLDDALCYSWLAQLAAGSVVQAGQHSRLLLSLESGANARAILQGAVTARKGNVPPPMLLDYSMTLYVTGDKGLSRTALARVLQSPVIDPGVRRTARLLRLIIALENNNEDEAKEVYFNLQDDDPKLCLKEERAKVIDPEHYWPMAITDAVQNLVVKLCDYEEQPLFES
jgi:tetratricopeptide (TPR) repeat protein